MLSYTVTVRTVLLDRSGTAVTFSGYTFYQLSVRTAQPATHRHQAGNVARCERRVSRVRPACHPGVVRGPDLRRRPAAADPQADLQEGLDDPGRNHGSRRRDPLGGVPA